MEIHALTLATADLSAQRDFYQNTLRLPVAAANGQQFTVQAGTSQLTFVQSPVEGAYHLAFNIPENQLGPARQWLRAPLIKAKDGRDEFVFDSWNAHSLYFYDAAGNILELIARHTLANTSTEPFGEKSLLSISEIGIAVENVNAFTACGELPFYGSHTDDFAPLGDEHGLLIVVNIGREWFPDTGKPALELPVHGIISSNGKRMQITGTPHAHLQVTEHH